MNGSQEKIINKTDLHFFKYCQEQFGINRGVYNTIEQWFYNKEIYEIYTRRKYILEFLKYVFGDDKGTGKFGEHGLTLNLKKFLKSNLKNDFKTNKNSK